MYHFLEPVTVIPVRSLQVPSKTSLPTRLLRIADRAYICQYFFRRVVVRRVCSNEFVPTASLFQHMRLTVTVHSVIADLIRNLLEISPSSSRGFRLRGRNDACCFRMCELFPSQATILTTQENRPSVFSVFVLLLLQTYANMRAATRTAMRTAMRAEPVLKWRDWHGYPHEY